jgi:hypothetical protein
MERNRRTLLAATLAAGFCFSGQAWGQGKTGPRKIVLGQAVPLTGAADQIGLAYAAGAKLFVGGFNSRKNGPGFTFELRQLDDSYDPATCAPAWRTKRSRWCATAPRWVRTAWPCSRRTMRWAAPASPPSRKRWQT